MLAIELTVDFLRPMAPVRPADGHKGTFGHVFVIAGSRGFTGAAKMTSLGAARSGAGLVTLGIARPLADIMATSLMEVMSVMLPSTDAETLATAAVEPALEFAAGKQAVVLGPGLSQHPETQEFVIEFLRRSETPMLIDADGLNALAKRPEVLLETKAPCVVTPHPGEMARLAHTTTADVQRDREKTAADFAAKYRCAVALKGYQTVIANADGEVYLNPTGNSGMGSGGTGDVLSGLVGGLMAQGISVFEAALLGVYLHGLAGDIAAAENTERALIAGDIIDAIGAAWRAFERPESIL